jgi:hypothetical protein
MATHRIDIDEANSVRQQICQTLQDVSNTLGSVPDDIDYMLPDQSALINRALLLIDEVIYLRTLINRAYIQQYGSEATARLEPVERLDL